MSTFNFVLSNWTYLEYNEFLNSFGNRQFQKAGYLAEKIIPDWTGFPDIPADAEHPIDHLSLEDATAVLLAIQTKTSEYVESLDLSTDVTVDLTKWKWNDFNKFSDHVQNGRIEKALDMMFDVCRLKKAQPKSVKEMNALQGIAMMSALTDKIKRVFSGGN